MPIIQVSSTLAIGITMGISVVISQKVGQDLTNDVKNTIKTSLIFFSFFSICLSLFGFFFASYFTRLIKVPPQIIKEATSYLMIIMLGSFGKIEYNVCNAVFRGLGNSLIPLIILIVSALLNIVFELIAILVFNLGIAGTALATIISQLLSYITSNIILNRKYYQYRYGHFNKTLLSQIIKIGLPSGLKAMLYWGGYTFISTTINQFGAVIVAAFGIASKIDSFVQTPHSSLNACLASFVGQNMGIGNLDRIKKAVKTSRTIGYIVAFISTVAVYVFAGSLLSLFTPDQQVIKEGIKYLRIVSVFYLVYSFQEVIQGVAVGSGHTIILMISTITAMWLVRIPIASILSARIGILGVWISIPSGWFVASMFTNIFYYSGKWKNNVLASTPVSKNII